MIEKILKKKILDSGLKHVHIAKQLGISKVWFSKCLNGHNDLSKEKLTALELLMSKQ